MNVGGERLFAVKTVKSFLRLEPQQLFYLQLFVDQFPDLIGMPAGELKALIESFGEEVRSKHATNEEWLRQVAPEAVALMERASTLATIVQEQADAAPEEWVPELGEEAPPERPTDPPAEREQPLEEIHVPFAPKTDADHRALQLAREIPAPGERIGRHLIVKTCACKTPYWAVQVRGEGRCLKCLRCLTPQGRLNRVRSIRYELTH